MRLEQGCNYFQIKDYGGDGTVGDNYPSWVKFRKLLPRLVLPNVRRLIHFCFGEAIQSLISSAKPKFEHQKKLNVSLLFTELTLGPHR